MKVGCFALIDPFKSLDHQLRQISEIGISHADITDNYSGASLGSDGGFVAAVSLEDNPIDIKRTFSRHGLSVTTVCAHASLLDPSTPARYSTSEIMKAVKLALMIGVDHVITTEGEPKTPWGKKLSFEQMVFITAEKLYEPVKLAQDLGVVILFESHGPVCDSIEGVRSLFHLMGNPEGLGLCLDTGNLWLGGANPLEFAEAFKEKILHVHWKDLPGEWEKKRGTVFGCGFSPIPLGKGVIDIPSVFEIAKGVRYCTLEVAGLGHLKESYNYLRSLGAE